MNKIGCYGRGGLLICTFIVIVITTIIRKLPINVTISNFVNILNLDTCRITLGWRAGRNLCAQLCRNNKQQQSGENTFVDFNWFHIFDLFFDIMFNIFDSPFTQLDVLSKVLEKRD